MAFEGLGEKLQETFRKLKGKGKLTEKDIKDARAVLFVINRGIEEVNEIERFIDVEYYEVEPCIALENPKQVISEIIADLN